MNRFVAYLFGIITLGVSLFIIYNQSMAGFPDGHRTEYDRASGPLFALFTCLNIAFSFYFFYIGYRKKSNRNLLVTILVYLVVALIVFFVSNHLYNTLDHGQGG